MERIPLLAEEGGA